MPKRKKNNSKRNPKRERHFVVRGVRRDPPDIRKLGRALLSLAQAEAERQAQAEHDSRSSAAQDPTHQPTDKGEQDDRRGS